MVISGGIEKRNKEFNIPRGCRTVYQAQACKFKGAFLDDKTIVNSSGL
jgi:hypothetical protein